MSEKKPDLKQLHDQILKEWAAKGMVVEGGWRGLSMMWGLGGAPVVQQQEMRKAFYAGAQHVFGSIMGLLDPGQGEPTDREMKVLDDIHKELDTFAAAISAVKNQ